MKLLAFAVSSTLWLALALAPAAADDLPDSVAEPYVAYQAAMETGDWAAALAAASTAWREAETARIDRALIGVLAANYGDLAFNMGRSADARPAFLRAAAIADAIPEPPAERAWRRWMAGAAALAQGDARAARTDNDLAMQLLERNPAAIDDHLASDILFMAVRLQREAGQIRRMRDSTRRAVEMIERAGRQNEPIFASASYMAGVASVFARDNVQAGYDFHVAANRFAQSETAHADALTCLFWIRMLRERMSTGERAALAARIAASPYAAADYESIQLTLPDEVREAAEQREPLVEDENNREARPVQRRSPEYPQRAAMAGIEGVVLAVFDVTETGRTDNIRIAAAAPAGLFEEVCERAIARWRYEPRIENGVPVRREGVVTYFDFQLDPPR